MYRFHILRAHSHRTKVEAKAKIFFEVFDASFTPFQNALLKAIPSPSVVIKCKYALVSTSVVVRLPAPHGDCEYVENLPVITRGNFSLTYAANTCKRHCSARLMIERCSCVDPITGHRACSRKTRRCLFASRSIYRRRVYCAICSVLRNTNLASVRTAAIWNFVPRSAGGANTKPECRRPTGPWIRW